MMTTAELFLSLFSSPHSEAAHAMLQTKKDDSEDVV